MLNNILFNAQLIDYREKRKYHAWMEIQLLNGKITVHSLLPWYRQKSKSRNKHINHLSVRKVEKDNN